MNQKPGQILEYEIYPLIIDLEKELGKYRC